MTMRNDGATTEDFQSLFSLGAMGVWADSKLISHFLTAKTGREVAFRILIRRHGPMVFAVCRRVLGDAHSAEDAFQATFLILVKKAGSIRDGEVLTGWLHGVARRVARKAKAREDRRRAIERRAADRAEAMETTHDPKEMRSIIDEEIGRLPARYREPLILCYLEGLRHQEIAERLDCPVGTVESRLSRGREHLRSRLVRRGLAPTAAVQGMLLIVSDVSTSVPSPLVDSTIRCVLGYVTRKMVAEAVPVASLAGIAYWSKLGVILTGMIACTGIVGVGAYWSGAVGASPEPPAIVEKEDKTAVPPKPPEPKHPVPPTEESRPVPVASLLPSRPDSATARPLSNIVIDGRLNDWPTGLQPYAINRRLVGNADYDPGDPGVAVAPAGHFFAGYDRSTERVYLAVVVPDEDLVAKAGSCTNTDAVEVYVEGLFSERSIRDWPHDASKLPVIQYVAVPGPVAAYDDKRGFNPSLVDGDLEQTSTQMAYHREGNVTTYEWAIQVFDRYPGRPTRLAPGKRIGLDVVVVDRDRNRPKPSWTYWGPNRTQFKGTDASLLGELILVDDP